ncbi:hypothetical protein L208DRAFT_806677 [Tricholoma matsutake]|nr:hypothetical protein L208DRAFT_806677 [Tricholoma matsutake 945]
MAFTSTSAMPRQSCADVTVYFARGTVPSVGSLWISSGLHQFQGFWSEAIQAAGGAKSIAGSCLFFRVLALRRAAHGGPWDINCSQGVQVTNAAVVFGD